MPEVTTIRCRAVLFDCDGVLVDSHESAEHAWRDWSYEFGLSPQAVLHGVHGRRSEETVAQHIPPGQRAAAARAIEELEVELAAETLAIPGAAALLAAVGAQSAIVTSASSGLSRARLQAAALMEPAVVVTAEDVTEGKPHPEPYLLAAARLGVPVGQCLAIEDSLPGVESARAAGVAAVLGIGYDALAAGADLAVPDLTSVAWTSSGVHVANTLSV